MFFCWNKKMLHQLNCQTELNLERNVNSRSWGSSIIFQLFSRFFSFLTFFLSSILFLSDTSNSWKTGQMIIFFSSFQDLLQLVCVHRSCIRVDMGAHSIIMEKRVKVSVWIFFNLIASGGLYSVIYITTHSPRWRMIRKWKLCSFFL